MSHEIRTPMNAILGFAQLVHFRDDQISSEYTALMSKVMWDGEGRGKLSIHEEFRLVAEPGHQWTVEIETDARISRSN